MKIVNWRLFAFSLSIIALLAFLVSRLWEATFLPTFLLCILAFAINTLVIESEDSSPGGWNNPIEGAASARNGKNWNQMKRIVGFPIFALGIALGVYIGNTFVTKRAEVEKDFSRVPVILVSVGCIYVGYNWMRGQRAG